MPRRRDWRAWDCTTGRRRQWSGRAATVRRWGPIEALILRAQTLRSDLSDSMEGKGRCTLLFVGLLFLLLVRFKRQFADRLRNILVGSDVLQVGRQQVLHKAQRQ